LVVVALVLAVAGLSVGLVLSMRTTADLRSRVEEQDRIRANLERSISAARSASDTQRDTTSSLEARLRHVEERVLNQPTLDDIADDVHSSVYTVITESAQGTGFVVGSDRRTSLLLTNFHVIESEWESGGRSVVLRRDATRLQGRVVKVNRQRDLALISTGHRLPSVAFATDRPSIGEFVLVFGSPHGFDATVTFGIISGQNDADHVQFSAPVSPGSSGGPLVDGEGNVVGITVSKVVSEATEGLSFAIPIETACGTVLKGESVRACDGL
jgi:putative serine protease PepD